MKSQILSQTLKKMGSDTKVEDLKPVKGTKMKMDPKTGLVFRVDLADKAHGETPNVHVFLNEKTAAKNKEAGKFFFDKKTGKMLPIAILTFGIASVKNLNAAVDSGQFAQALQAAKDGNVAEAEDILFEASIDMSIESGSAVPFYSINGTIGALR